MEKIYTREELLRFKKKFILNLLGHKNMKEYYSYTRDTNKKVSRKNLIAIYLYNNR